MASILDDAMAFLSPELVGKAATIFGVPPDGIQKAMAAAVPTVLGAVAGKAGDSGLMGQLFEMIAHPANSTNPTETVGNALAAMSAGASSPMLDIGKKLLSTVLGGSGDGIASAIGRMAGLGSAGSGIMSTVATLAMGVLGSKVRSGGLNVGSLSSMLMGERDSLMRAVPPSISALMGTGAPAVAVPAPWAGSSANVRRVAPAAVKKSSPILPILGVAAVAVVSLFWWLDRTPAAAKPVAVAVPETPPAAAPMIAPSATGLTGLKLPNGTEIQVSASGIENQLVGFIQDAARPIDKTTWFDFDRLLFQTGSATLEASSMDQLSNIAEIMKAFPAVTLKLGGYTDNVGKSSDNMKLSTDRANAAMAELVKLGVGADRLAAEGYGDTVPVADNGTADGRQKNRRTAARVTAR
jgi:OmpA-OmpF porin, OOP family